MLSANTTIRVLIAEDDYLVREGARAVLSTVDGVEVVGTAPDPSGLFELLDSTKPHAVMTDIRMPPTFTTEGIEVAHTIRRVHPEIGVVVLSQHADPEYALELLGDGSRSIAYLLKERLGDAEELVQAIREVVAGGSVLDPKIVNALMEAQRRRSSSKLAGLTSRETEVLAHMASGKTNAAIADGLVVTERAVEKHVGGIFAKLGLHEDLDVNRRVAAVLFYLQRSTD